MGSMLTSINADNNLNKDNIIEKIKEKLEKEDPDIYKEWQDNQFGIDYVFNGRFALLHKAAQNGHTKTVEVLIGRGADINVTDVGLRLTPLH